MNKQQFKDIIGQAVEREMQAQDLYISLSKRAANPEVASLLEKLSKEERGHRDLLRKVLEQDETEFTSSTVPDLELESSEDDVVYSDDMSYKEALTMAIKDEQASTELYLLMADTSLDKDVKDLFTSLAKHEAAHKKALEELL